VLSQLGGVGVTGTLSGVTDLLEEGLEPMFLHGSWFALPTRDQGAVLAAFGLSDAVPVTMRRGAEAWSADRSTWAPRPLHHLCRRMYVTPVVDGWTLVFGEVPVVAHPPDRSPPTCRECEAGFPC